MDGSQELTTGLFLLFGLFLFFGQFGCGKAAVVFFWILCWVCELDAITTLRNEVMTWAGC